jgi:hypothetical protein
MECKILMACKSCTWQTQAVIYRSQQCQRPKTRQWMALFRNLRTR